MINDVEFHDLPVFGIDLLLVGGKITITCGRYNETNKGYDQIAVCFENVTNIFTDLIEILDPGDVEIASLDLEETESVKKAHFRFLTGYSNPEMTLSFVYENVNYSWLQA